MTVPSKHDTARQFGRMSHAYAESTGHARGTDLQIVINFLEPTEEMIILDVATGAGHTALAAALRSRYVVATDLSAEMIHELRRLAASRSIPNVTAAVMDVEDLAFPDASFDAVTCRIAAHHFHNVDRAVSEIARVLRPGGRFVLEDSMSPHNPVLDRFLNGVETLRDPTHIRSYTEIEWRGLIEAAGLQFQWARAVKKKHNIADWIARSGLSEERTEEVYAVFASASDEIREYFQVEYENLKANSFTDDKLIFRAEKV